MVPNIQGLISFMWIIFVVVIKYIVCLIKLSVLTMFTHRPSRHRQTTDPVQLKLCLSHKRRLSSNADLGFYCVNIMTTSFSSPERIV